MATHRNLDKSAVGRIGLWEDEDKIVGVATFDTKLGAKKALGGSRQQFYYNIGLRPSSTSTLWKEK